MLSRINKFGITPVVAVILILIVSVLSVATFQNWFGSFSDTLLLDVESKTSNSFNNLETERIIGENLYLFNGADKNITFDSIQINGVDCGFVNESISSGVDKFDVSSCLDNSSYYQEVLIVSGNNLIERTLSLDQINPVSVMSGGLVGGNLTGFAYSENLGYISFSGPNYGVMLNNNLFSGFAYGENIGYISFNGSNYNVSINNNLLSGFAYSENLGYISFSGSGYNVSIDNSTLVGYAYGENIGYIHFNESGIYGKVTYS